MTPSRFRRKRPAVSPEEAAPEPAPQPEPEPQPAPEPEPEGSQLKGLVVASHPAAALAMAGVMALAAAVTGRTLREVGLVAVTVLVGQLILGLLNDVVDRHRDKQVDRPRKPIAHGELIVGNATFTIAVLVLLVVPLSVANGTAAGLAHLAFLVVAVFSTYVWRGSALSPLPWAASFALLPAFLAYGGWGGGTHGSPPTLGITVLAALVGVGIHVVRALPDLVYDNHAGLRHLPLRIALKTGAPRLLLLTALYLAAVGIPTLLVVVTSGVNT